MEYVLIDVSDGSVAVVGGASNLALSEQILKTGKREKPLQKIQTKSLKAATLTRIAAMAQPHHH